jgi:hypothetical protein
MTSGVSKVMRITALGLALSAVGLVGVALGQDRPAEPAAKPVPAQAGPARARGGRRGALRDRIQNAAGERRDRFLQFLVSLQATDDQRRLVLEKARAAEPIVTEVRAERRRIVAKAWAAAAQDPKADRQSLRTTMRTELQALGEKTRTQLEPLAKDVVAALTEEQRQKLQEAAARHGRSADDAALTRFATRLISRPMTAAYLEARLGR